VIASTGCNPRRRPARPHLATPATPPGPPPPGYPGYPPPGYGPPGYGYPPPGGKKPSLTWLWITLGVLGALMIAVVIWLLTTATDKVREYQTRSKRIEAELFLHTPSADGRSFTATAIGDLDCDGVTTTLTVTGAGSGGAARLEPVERPVHLD
jgi:hypothetical protein